MRVLQWLCFQPKILSAAQNTNRLSGYSHSFVIYFGRRFVLKRNRLPQNFFNGLALESVNIQVNLTDLYAMRRDSHINWNLSRCHLEPEV